MTEFSNIGQSRDVYKIIGADGKEYGPIASDVLRHWIAEGRANGQTKVLLEGATEWKSISEVPELAAFLVTQPAPTPGAPAPISLAPVPRNNSYAVAGLTLGIISLTVGICCCYGFPFSVPGIICSSVALNQIKADPSTQQGKSLATAGLILSIISVILGLLLVIFAASLGTPEIMRKFRRL